MDSTTLPARSSRWPAKPDPRIANIKLVTGSPSVYEPRPIKPSANKTDILDSGATKRKRRTTTELYAVRRELYAILAECHPQTVRQVFYQATVRQVVPKTERAYKGTVGILLGKMRMEGQIPFEWIADSTRWMRKSRTYSSLEDCLALTAETYRRAIWNNQNAYVEVWLEKDALAGVLIEETSKWDVPLMVTKGFASSSYLYEAAQAIIRADKPCFLYYFGDRDPSGVHIDRDIEKKLRKFAPDAEIHFKRLAVTREQIDELDLPTRPNKKGDSRCKGFEGDSVEVDSIPADVLRQMVRDCIAQHVDRDLLEKTTEIERQERATLMHFSKMYADDKSQPTDGQHRHAAAHMRWPKGFGVFRDSSDN